jgi:hypothetical protein
MPNSGKESPFLLGFRELQPTGQELANLQQLQLAGWLFSDACKQHAR